MNIDIKLNHLVIIVIVIIFTIIIANRIINLFPTEREIMLKKLLRQSIRYQVAAKQDINILLAVLHANYAASYMFAINDLFSTYELEQVLQNRKNRLEYEKRIIETQDWATKRAIKSCPNYGGITMTNDIIMKLAGEG
jgi:hypothetical protein